MSLGQENTNPNTQPVPKVSTNKIVAKDKEDQQFQDIATVKPVSTNVRRKSLANVASLLDQIPLQDQPPTKKGLGGVTRSSRRLSLNAAVAPEKSDTAGTPQVYIDI
jgi:hypothetical protein